jgi:Icc-related predicted phosphoesterase
MTSLIALPDIHDKSEPLKRIARPLFEADAIVLPGDMTNGNMNHLLRLFNILEEFNEHIYAVPGNMDTYAMLAHLAHEGLNLHRNWQMLDGFALCGVGGALPFAGDFVFREAELAAYLDDCIRGLPADTPVVLVCHQPPFNTACDRLPNGDHVGSHAVRAFIERVQPLVCFTGHIHEAQSIDTIGRTRIVNPGPVWLSHAYAYAEIENGILSVLEIRQV